MLWLEEANSSCRRYVTKYTQNKERKCSTHDIYIYIYIYMYVCMYERIEDEDCVGSCGFAACIY